MRGHLDLERTVVAAVLCALVAALVPWEIVRIVAALPLALFLPGYAIIAAAFGPRLLLRPQLLLLSVATSLATLVVGALLLNVLPGGLRTATWALLLVVVVLAGCRAAALRRPKPKKRKPWASRPRIRRVDAVLLAAAAVIAVAAIALAEAPLPAKDASGYTALWMLPTDAKEESVQVGVISAEQDSTGYLLKVRVAGRKEPVTSRFALDPGEEKTIKLGVGHPLGRKPVRVTAYLYNQDEAQRPYRRVTSWLPRKRSLP